MALIELGLRALGSDFTDASIVSLSAGQAAGTAPILAADPDRTALIFYSATDFAFGLEASPEIGLPVDAYKRESFIGGECPKNALYLVPGLLATNGTLLIWVG